MGLGKAFLHELPCTQEVGSGLEDEDDGRQPGDGLRSNHVDPGDSVQEVAFERDGD
jgi:hypothetical protein